MSTSASFRAAEPADLALLESLCQEYRLDDHQPAHPERVNRALRLALAGDPFIRIWLIERGDTVVGYLAVSLGYSLEVGGREAFIDEIYVREAERNGGIGSLAIEFAEHECKKLDVQRLNLEVEVDNTRARRLYERLAFVDHGRTLMSKML